MLKSRFNGRIYRVKAGKGTTHFARELRNVQSILNRPDSQLLSSSDDFEGVFSSFWIVVLLLIRRKSRFKMPRSFLLRRSLNAAAEDSRSDIRTQNKGYKKASSFPEDANPGKRLKRSFGTENIIWLNEENKIRAPQRSYMYQSYIDGDTTIKNNAFPTSQFFVSPPEKIESQLEILNKEAAKSEPESRELPAPAPGLKPIYRCEQCGKTFKTKYTLTIHLKMPSHTGARPFVCNICGKGFRLSSTLCRHKIIHTSDKPHKCHVCDKAFNRSSTLKTHIRTHSEKKEFVCDVCGKGFHQKGNLRNHFLIHTGEKPYSCRLCNKAFNKLSNLKFHLHVHTDNTPYRCRYCKTTFSRRCDLKQHIQTAHAEEQNNERIDADEI